MEIAGRRSPLHLPHISPVSYRSSRRRGMRGVSSTCHVTQPPSRATWPPSRRRTTSQTPRSSTNSPTRRMPRSAWSYSAGKADEQFDARHGREPVAGYIARSICVPWPGGSREVPSGTLGCRVVHFWSNWADRRTPNSPHAGHASRAGTLGTQLGPKRSRCGRYDG